MSLARQVAEALGAAHEAGLVHRDLKAENVMVTPGGQAKVLDFGLVKESAGGELRQPGEGLTEDGQVVGTYRAMAPEQARGGPADPRSDLFSLGVLLYELATGSSPFLGTSALHTLHRLQHEVPAPASSLRPEVPPALEAVLGTLLEKDPQRRPASAEQVALALAAVERLLGSPSSSAAGAGRPGVRQAGDLTSDQPTSTTVIVPPASPPPASPPPASSATASSVPASSATASSVAVVPARLRRRWLAGAGLLVILVLAVLAAWWRWPSTPLRVAVLPVTLEASQADDADLQLLAAGLPLALLRGLLSLQGVTPVDPAELRHLSGSPAQVGRAAAVDEVLTASVRRTGATAQVELRRVRAADGALLWTDRFEAPVGDEVAMTTATAVVSQVGRAYAERSLRRGVPVLEVSPEDYAEYLRVQQRVNAGKVPWAPELEHLEALGRSSPRFLEGHLLAARLALDLFTDSRDAAYLDRARAALEMARSLAPGDFRILSLEINLALRRGDWPAAEQAIAELEKLQPGDLRVPWHRSQLAEARGQTDAAIAFMEQAVARRPAWRSLLRLADLQYRAGRVDAARDTLGQLLQRAPGNTWALAKLGELELLYGDLERAEEVYGQLVAQPQPQRADWTNLGLTQFLLGRYEQAVDSYRHALAIDPGQLTATLNLADAELARGRRPEAEELYRQVLVRLGERPPGVAPTAVERTMRAQCLARLGDARQAVAIVLETLQQYPQDAEVTYQAALVYSLVGEQASALASAKKALAMGVQPVWFRLPAFADLRADPQLAQQLESSARLAAPGAQPAS